MSTLSPLLTTLVLWTFVAIGFSATALVRLRARTRRPSRGLPREHHVLLLRPLDRPQPHELTALGAPLPRALAVDHVVLSPEPVPLDGLRWVPSHPVTGNRKVGHLLRGLLERGAEHGVVIAADADVQVDEPMLAALAEAVDGGAALAMAAPVPILDGRSSLGVTAVFGLLARSAHSFLVLDAVTRGARPICGKALALGPAALSLLPELGDCIGEDLELAARLHQRGERVVVVDALAPSSVDARTTPWAAIERFTRWMQVLKAHRPSLFPFVPLLFCPTPPLVALALWLWHPALAAAVALLVLGRTLLARRLAALDGRGAVFSWWLGEALLVTAWLNACFRRTVEWRGRRLRLLRGGVIRT